MALRRFVMWGFILFGILGVINSVSFGFGLFNSKKEYASIYTKYYAVKEDGAVNIVGELVVETKYMSCGEFSDVRDFFYLLDIPLTESEIQLISQNLQSPMWCIDGLFSFRIPSTLIRTDRPEIIALENMADRLQELQFKRK
jgi:hypothetical protein